MTQRHIDTPDSTSINWVEYSPDTQELKVQFKNGSTYLYEEVPSQVAEPFFDLHVSPGTYHARAIRKGGYKYMLLAPELSTTDDQPTASSL